MGSALLIEDRKEFVLLNEDLKAKVKDKLNNMILENPVLIYGMRNCLKTLEIATNWIRNVNEPVVIVYLDEMEKEEVTLLKEIFKEKFVQNELPIIFINNRCIGGHRQIMPLLSNNIGSCDRLFGDTYQYDVFVIGDGPSGLTAALEASSYYLVGLCGVQSRTYDEIEEIIGGYSAIGRNSKLNQECLPKYYLHKEIIKLKKLSKIKTLKWTELINNIKLKIDQNAIENYNKIKFNKNIRYFNAKATFIDSHTLKLYENGRSFHEVRAKKIIIATGTEIIEQNVKNATEFGITSDILFMKENISGKFLIVGSPLRCMEMAGILVAFDVECSVIFNTEDNLNQHDSECLNHLVHILTEKGVQFLNNHVLLSLSKSNQSSASEENSDIMVQGFNDNLHYYGDIFQSVVFTNTRRGRTEFLNLETIGLDVNKENGKIIGQADGRTNNPCVYVVGGVLDKVMSENSTGIQMAKNIVQNMILPDSENIKLDVNLFIPRVVLTPVEYGFIGFSEEKAMQVFGAGNFVVYKAKFTTLNDDCMIKLITINQFDVKIVGVHIIGHDVGDILQGLVVIMQSDKLTLEDVKEIIHCWNYDVDLEFEPVLSDEFIEKHAHLEKKSISSDNISNSV